MIFRIAPEWGLFSLYKYAFSFEIPPAFVVSWTVTE